MSVPDLDQAIVDLVARGEVKVPPYPAVAFRIEALLRAGDYGVDDLAKLVSSDQVLAADVIRCANSAAYARGTQAASVKQAVARVGAKDVAALALASGLGSHATAPGKLASLRRQAWLDALAAALLCQALAPRRKLAPDVAFAAGLLHDFGRVVAIACIEDIVAHQNAEPRSEAAWGAVIDRYHVELGIVMAARWGLPPVLADVISMHHGDPAAAADPALVDAVAAADEVVSLLGGRVALPPEDLGLASLVATAEHDAVGNALRGLPAFIASFETPEAWRGVGESLVAHEPPARREAPPPPAHEVRLSLGGKEHGFRILGVASTHLMLTGSTAVPENMLLHMKVCCDPPLEGFASVKLSWPEGDGIALLLQPYALTGDALARWKTLVVEAGPH
jgi:putative nucleotidyltransferase with HDIG domain